MTKTDPLLGLFKGGVYLSRGGSGTSLTREAHSRGGRGLGTPVGSGSAAVAIRMGTASGRHAWAGHFSRGSRATRLLTGLLTPWSVSKTVAKLDTGRRPGLLAALQPCGSGLALYRLHGQPADCA